MARRATVRKDDPVPEAPAHATTPVAPVVPDLDRLIHERARLGVVSALAANDLLSFNELKRLLDTTDGNLSIHMRKLEEAGYVAMTKRFEGRLPRTEFRLTDAGRQAFTRYLDHIEAILKAARGTGQ